MKNTTFGCVLALILAAVLALGGCATNCPAGGCPDDQKLAQAVEAAMAQHTELQAPNQISVQCIRGTVYLNGQVATELQRSTAKSVAKSVPGVLKVVDNIALPYQGR
jgi:hyperosmotically inducible periplasmic protein